MRNGKLLIWAGAAVVLVLTPMLETRAAAPATAPSQVWQYTLLPGSQLTDECPVCDRVPIVVGMRGTFRLRLLQENPLFSTYAVEELAFQAGGPPGATYKVQGSGVYQVGGEVGVRQDLYLAVWIDNGWTNQLCSLAITNDAHSVTRPWPMLQVSVDQTNGTIFQQFRLELSAAPLREVWFSTTHGFTPESPGAAKGYVSAGDLVSSAGRVVKRNQELSGRLGIMPIVPDLGLDAMDVLPGGEIVFSITQDIFSETLGSLRNGDVLSDRGRVITNGTALMSAFGPEPPAVDEGLDALQILPAGETYFSVTNDFFSKALGRTVRKGDMLSSRGVIVKTNEELIARFQPADPKQDYGLDAIHVWPSGEVWFSVETRFYGQHFESYEAGDLLSDQGYVVYHNSELLAAFAPLENLVDFGLDALFVVSDADVPSTIASADTATVRLEPTAGGLSFDWTGGGRVFQIEKATNVLGPWLPLSPVVLEPPVTDQGAVSNTPEGFYRLRQW